MNHRQYELEGLRQQISQTWTPFQNVNARTFPNHWRSAGSVHRLRRHSTVNPVTAHDQAASRCPSGKTLANLGDALHAGDSKWCRVCVHCAAPKNTTRSQEQLPFTRPDAA